MPEENAEINWDEAHISFSLSDLTALQQNLDLEWDGKKYDFQPGFKVSETGVALKGSGLSAFVPINKDKQDKAYKFSFDVDINGSDSIEFVPLGRETKVTLTSNWPSPSFDGAFLPDERNVTNNGFEAKWKILELNRDYPQVWAGSLAQDIQASSFGVRLLVMVDEYQKNTRSVKYAIMFIALTFMVFFFVEVLNRIRIHPIQYILVGLSLVLFFSLLLSITEHLNFNLAYLISSLATVMLITLYSKTIFKNTRLTLIQGGVLAAIYIFLYTIIQMEDYSLLFGSIGLFVVMAIVMYISRKIDWYSLGAKKSGNDK
jgi:inner membrane protein